MQYLKNKKLRKVLIGIAGGIVLAAGVLMIPYPGPGWVVVFIGLSILATEFKWAQDIHDYAHGKYDAWKSWLASKPAYIRAIFWCLTCLVVIVTVWLVNGYGLMNQWFNLGQSWLVSPLVK